MLKFKLLIMKNIAFIMVGFLLSLSLLSQPADNNLITLTDVFKIKNLGGIQITQDASKVAFTVTASIPDESNPLDYKYQTQIYSYTFANPNSLVQLTTGSEGARNPVWSPDGKWLCFVRNVKGKSQLFLLPMQGGEAIQITHFSYGAFEPVWSPDGKKILFASAIALEDIVRDTHLNPNHYLPSWSLEKPGIENKDIFKFNQTKPNPDGTVNETRTYLNLNSKDKKALVLDKLNFQNELNLSADLNFKNYFLIDPFNNNLPPVRITLGFFNYSNAQFFPDGENVLMSGNLDPLEHPDRSLKSEIFVLNIPTKQVRTLLSDNNKRFTQPVLAPGGESFAFLTNSTSFVSVDTLCITSVHNPLKDIKHYIFDRNKNKLIWTNDESFIYFTSQSNGGVPICRVEVKTGHVEVLSDYESGITDYDLVSDKLVIAKTEVRNPSELYLTNTLAKYPLRIGNFNEWVSNKTLSFPVKNTFKDAKGLEIEYWTMKPTQFKEGQTYPLLLEIHGGPSAMWGPGEASMWHEYQYFCSKGYGIVYSNPRGSGGYGNQFLRSNIKDWGAGPASDVLGALKKVTTQSWVDTHNVFITGGSYAGYLVAWIIAHNHQFRAACSQRGVYDLTTFFGEGNAWRLIPNYFGGYPWEPKVKELLIKESPITYVHQIVTPYIIFHGGNDRRTGFVQAEMMFRSLKVLNRPVEFVVHPGASHEITRSGDGRQKIDQMLRTYEFFERWRIKEYVVNK